MTSIERLQVQGIRSYSPFEAQEIHFYKPLTIIVGQNGCGKTTIIECLKQATTGDLPPNCKNGQNFIHDPNLAVTMEVKGQIKLRFRSSDGKPVVCSRSFLLTQRQKKKEYKQLESVLQSLDSTGAKVTMSTKCSDLNKLVPQLMGVSHAILENVIFCHQEESNWCLGDDATLKKKFDEIFAAARYTKALEEIRKFKNEKANRLKVLRAELETAEQALGHAQKLRASVDAERAKLDDIKAQLEAATEQLAELELEIRELEEKAKAFGEAEARRVRLRTERKEKEASMQEVRNNLATQYGGERTCDDDELQRLVDAAASSGAERKDAERTQRARLEEGRSRRQAVEGRLAAAQEKLSHLRAEEGVHKRRAAERDSIASELSVSLGLGGAPGGAADEGGGGRSGARGGRSGRGAGAAAAAPLSAEAVADFAARLDAEVSAREARAAEARAARAAGLSEATRNVEAASLGASSARDELRRRGAELEKVSSELSAAERPPRRGAPDVASQLTQLTNGSHTDGDVGTALRVAETELAAHEAERDELRERRQAGGLAARLAGAEQSQRALRERRKTLMAELDDASRRRAASAGFDQSAAALARANAELGRALQASAPTIDAALAAAGGGGGGAGEARRALESGALARAADAARARADEAETAASARARDAGGAVQRLVAAQQARAAALKDQASAEAKAEGELRARGLEELLPEDADLEKVVQDATAGVLELSSKLAVAEAMPTYTQRALEMVERKKCCMLCLRAVVAEEKAAVIKAIGKTAGLISGGSDALKATRDAEQKKLGELRDAAPHWRSHRAAVAKAKELRALSARAAGEEQQAQAAAQEAERALEAAKGEARAAAALCALVERLAPHAAEAARLQRIVDDARDHTSLRAAAAARSHEAVMEDVKAADAQLEAGEGELRRLQEEADQAETQWRRLEAKLGADRLLIEKLTNLKRADDDAKARRGALRAQHAQLEAEVARLRASAAPLEAALGEAKAARDRDERALGAAEADAADAARAAAEGRARFRAAQADIEAYDARGAPAQLGAAEAAAEGARAELARARSDEERLEAALKEAARQATRHEVEAAELHENLRFRRLRAARDAAQRRLDAADADVRALGEAAESVPELLARAQQRRSKLVAERAERIGAQRARKEALEATQKELRSDGLKKVDESHRAKSIDVQTHTTVLRDLDAYAKALDRSLMKFHSKKMADINGTIRELWQRTYQGHDIDAIEIQSEHEGETATGKRIHKYRVVMRKGDAYLDMRGRCSAGQKVLASLIIRLALAETFCLNCGILALDEPTTNLDHANVEAFARALNEIIQQRRAQANFQLIVITHDEPFVQLVGRAENADYYYKVFKNEQQYSCVERQAIADF